MGAHIVDGKPGERLRYDPGVRDANKIDGEASAPAQRETTWKRVGASGDVPVNGIKEFALDGICDGSVLTCLEHMWQFDARTGARWATRKRDSRRTR